MNREAATHKQNKTHFVPEKSNSYTSRFSSVHMETKAPVIPLLLYTQLFTLLSEWLRWLSPQPWSLCGEDFSRSLLLRKPYGTHHRCATREINECSLTSIPLLRRITSIMKPETGENLKLLAQRKRKRCKVQAFMWYFTTGDELKVISHHWCYGSLPLHTGQRS